MNIIILFLEIILSSICMLYLFNKYKYEGLHIWLIISIVLISILSQITIEIFALKINLGFVLNTIIILSSNIITQRKGYEEADKYLTTISYTLTILFTIMILSSLLPSSDINKLTNNSYNLLLNLNNRVFFASTISILLSLYLNSRLYHKIRQIKNKIWISNILSTIITNFIESVLFIVLAYSITYKAINVIELIVIRYIFKVIIGLIGTNILYIANTIKDN